MFFGSRFFHFGAVFRSNMVKFLKPGKIVIVLQGKFAGKKAVIVKAYPDGTKKRPFHHCLVVGLQRPPKILKKKMSEKQRRRANTVRPFCKYVNVRHLMPTRYSLDNYQDLSPNTAMLSDDKQLKKRDKAIDWDEQNPEKRRESMRAVKVGFESRYAQGTPKKKERWFYTKLAF